MTEIEEKISYDGNKKVAAMWCSEQQQEAVNNNNNKTYLKYCNEFRQKTQKRRNRLIQNT